MKKGLFIIFILIWGTVIFMFSNSDSYSSNTLSKSIGEAIIDITSSLNIINIDDENRYEIIMFINKPIRKIAHMFEYFILSLLLFNFFKKFKLGKKKYYITAGICFLYSIFDEFHQTFINGRTGQFSDCLIDMIGAMIYIILVYFSNKRRKRKLYEEV